MNRITPLGWLLLPAGLCLVLAGGCISSGDKGPPASVEKAVQTLKSSNQFTDRRDTGYWLRDQIVNHGKPVTLNEADELFLLKALCDWAVQDVRPPAAGRMAPEAFSDHEFLVKNLADRPGVAIAREAGNTARGGTLRVEAFTYYYDMAARDAHAIQPAEFARIKALYNLGKLTKFEQATFKGVRYENLVFIQFQIGLGTEHHLWIMDKGEWKWLHQVGAWIG